jgi:hypothetical protein
MSSRNLQEMVFGRLTAAYPMQERSSDGHLIWMCNCECGNTKAVTQNHLTKGSTKSCGCLKKEQKPGLTHGMKYTPIYAVWQGIKSRCYKPSHRSYQRYGGKGISVCDRWLYSFENFYQDMGEGYKKGLDIDRINNKGNYEPGNCRWSTRAENCRNRSSTRLSAEDIGLIKSIYVAGTPKLALIANEFGVSKTTIHEVANNKRSLDVNPIISY